MSKPDEHGDVGKTPLKQRIFCNTCGGARLHELKFTHHGQSDDPAEDRFLEEWTDSLWVCCGCESATLVHRWAIPDLEGETGAPQPEVHLYPPRTYGKKQPKHFSKLPRPLSRLYKETIEAFNSGSMLLCTLGLRALIEGVCVDKGLRKGNLEKKIDGLSAFFSNRALIDSLHGFRFAGNDAAHDLAAMYPADASYAINIMEDLLNFLYDFDYKASGMKNAARNAEIREQRARRTGGSAKHSE